VTGKGILDLNDQTPQEYTSEQPRRKFYWGCLLLVILVAIFVISLILVSGPTLIVSASRLLGDDARSIQQPDQESRYLDLRLQLRPDSVELYDALGQVTWSIQRQDLLIPLLELGLRLWPDSAELHNALGVIFYTNDQPSQAIRHFLLAVQQDEELAAVQNNLGVALFSKSRSLEAIPHLQAAVSLDPGNPQVFINLGNAYMSAELHKQAVQAYQQAAALDPELSSPWVVIGRIFLNMGKLEQAQESFLKALEVDPTHHLALQGQGVIAIYEGVSEDAFAYLESARNVEPLDAVTRLYLGLAFVALDNPQDANLEIEQAIVLSEDPNLIEIAKTQLLKLFEGSPVGTDQKGGEATKMP
jgi:tetratricopeptide (TPR) repeat protein